MVAGMEGSTVSWGLAGDQAEILYEELKRRHFILLLKTLQ